MAGNVYQCAGAIRKTRKIFKKSCNDKINLDLSWCTFAK